MEERLPINDNSGLNLLENDLTKDLEKEFEKKVHLRVKKRTGRKYLTSIENLPAELSFKKLLKAFKMKLNCNGTINESDSGEKVIVLQGDHRDSILNFLVTEVGIKEKTIVVHGF